MAPFVCLPAPQIHSNTGHCRSSMRLRSVPTFQPSAKENTSALDQRQDQNAAELSKPKALQSGASPEKGSSPHLRNTHRVERHTRRRSQEGSDGMPLQAYRVCADLEPYCDFQCPLACLSAPQTLAVLGVPQVRS